MKSKRPVLSICIPTYNRAEYLKGALENIINDTSFDDRVEIVISDNASTDNTYDMINEYCAKYDNIKYFRNPENIKDRNFLLALSRGTGLYVRLFNDTLRFTPGSLKRMVDTIESSNEQVPLFFFLNAEHTKCKFMLKHLEGAGEFIRSVSFYITWIANFGCWKKNLKHIVMPNQFSHLQLAQVDWFMQLVLKYNNVSVYFENWFVTESPTRKGGYNIFKVFIDNYLYILRQKYLSRYEFMIEKYRLFRYFILQWMVSLAIDDGDKYYFSLENKWKILFKHYWMSPYFYIGVFFYLLKTWKK